MDNNCQLVVFSDKAYNAIIRETFEWDPVETGGILLGHVLDNGCWIVMEVLPPGYGEGREGDNVYHEYGYFEYNRTFVNYLAKSVAEQYEIPLELLGLWHRHPGSMDYFSPTDDKTNSTFAAQNSHGVISGLINIDPQLRMTMYYLAHSDVRGCGRPNYQMVDIEVGSDLIPEEFFKLRYYKGEGRDLHPYAPQRCTHPSQAPQEVSSVSNQQQETSEGNATEEHLDGNRIIREQMVRNRRGNHQQEPHCTTRDNASLSVAENLIENIKKNKKIIILTLALIGFLFSILSIKNDFSKDFNFLGSDDNVSGTVVTEEVNTSTSEVTTNGSDKDENTDTNSEPKEGQEKTNEEVPDSQKSEKDNVAMDVEDIEETTKKQKEIK